MRGTWLAALVAIGLFAGRAWAEPARDFGAGVTLAEPTPLAELMAQPDAFAGAPVLVRGRIADVCQRKGCWSVLRDETAQVRVRFEDYGFFLPKDCMGQQALVEGRITVETLSEAEARHYESESRDGDPEAVQGPRREIGITASGVRLLARD